MNRANITLIERQEPGVRSVQEIVNLLALSGQDFLERLRERVRIQDYVEKLHRHAVTFSLSYGDSAAGFAAVYMNDPHHRTTFLSHIGVAESARGTGVASTLMKYIIDDVSERGFSEIRLEVHKLNTKARRLYAKLGFSLFEDSSPAVRGALFFPGNEDQTNLHSLSSHIT
ncbi:MAG: GNAT family N-acetyltransferase [Fuerstiella sp.]